MKALVRSHWWELILALIVGLIVFAFASLPQLEKLF